MDHISTRIRIVAACLAAAALIPSLYLTGGLIELRGAHEALAAQDYGRAADTFESAAQHLAWRPDLWARAAESALLAGDPERVVRMLEAQPDLDEAASLALAQAHVQLGFLDAAIQTYQRAIHVHGGSAALYSGLAEIYRAQGDHTSERVALESLLLHAADDAGASYRLGLLLMLEEPAAAPERLLMASGMDPAYDPAVQTLRTAINLAAIEPETATKHILIGRGLGLVAEWPLAADAFEAAIRENGQDSHAWAWLGEAKQHLGEDGRAELDMALQLDPSSVLVHAMRGLYWKRVGNEREALAEYQAAAQLEPQNPTWKTALGESYARLGDLVSALSVYQRATELSPDDPGTWRLLATFCVEYGVQVEEIGLPAAMQAVELAPADALAIDVLGWNQLAVGWFVSAEETLQSAIEIDPTLTTAHLHLAMTYLQIGDRAAAYEQLLRVQELDPDGPFGAQAASLLSQNYLE